MFITFCIVRLGCQSPRPGLEREPASRKRRFFGVGEGRWLVHCRVEDSSLLNIT